MNSYCTIAQLGTYYDTRLIGELSDDTGSNQVIDVIVQMCLDTGASKLDSVLNNRWALPAVLPNGNAPLILTQTVAALSMWFLFRRRQRVPPTFIQSDIMDSQAFLRDLVSMDASIPGLSRYGSQPALIASGSFTGASKFDPPSRHIGDFVDFPPSSTSTGGKNVV